MGGRGCRAGYKTGRARKIRRRRGLEYPTFGMRATFGRQPTRRRCLVYREDGRSRRKDAKSQLNTKFVRSGCISSRSCSKQKQGSGIEMLERLAVVQVGRNYESWAEKPGVERRVRRVVPCSWLQLSSVLTCVVLGMEDRRKLTESKCQERRWNER